jgi:outer membrane receptor protein involved in Fe transport
MFLMPRGRAVSTFSLAVALTLSCTSLALAKGHGILHGVVFGPDGGPEAGVLIEAGGAKQHTNQDGSLHMPVPAGKQDVYVVRQGKRQLIIKSVKFIAGETTELLISLPLKGAPQVDVEMPGKQQLAQRKKVVGPVVTVRGRVIDAAKKRPIAGARVFARGTDAEATSGTDGRFVIKLPIGRHDLTIIHPSFGTEQIPGVIAKKGGSPDVSVNMTPAAVALADFTITAPKITGGTAELLQERKASTTVSELIGAEQMSKSGDSDAASALSRVTGITVVGGKYVYVRGLGERYSATLLNQSSLPSPEPERRVVPLDMFPAGALQSIVIQKTYSADMPGEFGGGVVKLRTRGYPTKFTATRSLSAGFNTRSTFYNGLTYSGSGLDPLGFGASDRQMPKWIRDAIADQPVGIVDPVLGTGFSAKDLERFGEGLQNVWNTRRRINWPNLGMSLTVGDSYTFSGHKAGYLFSLSYDNAMARRIRENLRFTAVSGDELITTTSYRGEEIENSISLSAIAAAGFDSKGGHSIRLTHLTARISDDETRLLVGFDDNAGSNTRLTRLRYIERMLLFNQLSGHHPLLKLKKKRKFGLDLDWRYAFSLATRQEPDRREYRYDELSSEPGTFAFTSRAGGNQRFFSDLHDLNHDFGGSATLHFRQWSGLETKIKVGGAVMFKDREVDTRRFQYLNRGPRAGDVDILVRPPETVLSADNIGENGFRFTEGTRASDNYLAEQRLWAVFGSVDLPLTKSISLSVGVRLESSRQTVTTFELFTNDKVEATIDKLDVLPALLLSYRPFEQHVFRLGASQIVSRPEFRELSPAGFTAVTGNKLITGNPKLRRALLQNADLRWEWYPSRTESISVAVFYKHFSSPIEPTVEASGGSQLILSPVNADGAHNIGVEIEARKSLDFIHKALRDFTFSGNASFIFSRVDLGEGGVQTDKVRPLQGQSPWVFNFFLSYDNVDIGTSARLLYNVYGARIREVGANRLPNIVEQPFHQLDFVFRQKLTDNLSLSFKAKNLIDGALSFTQKNPERRRGYRGQRLSQRARRSASP